MLDIGTSGYTDSRIRCNATVGGYTGYAELRAADSYDMFLNLRTTRTDGGWMFFKIFHNSYIQLSGSDNKVNTYKDTAISGNLDAGVGDSTPYIKTSADDRGNTLYCELKTVNRDHGKLRSNTNYAHGTLYLGFNSSNFFRLTNWSNEIIVYKPTIGTSDDRLKENEEFI